MIHCEWRPITDACKADYIYVWDGYALVKAHWARRNPFYEYAWCEIVVDQYGEYCYEINPQPKYYLEVVPPPEK